MKKKILNKKKLILFNGFFYILIKIKFFLINV